MLKKVFRLEMEISMVEIQLLITKFRNAIDKAKENGEFDDDFMFKHFPRGCCGDAAYLLGEFLAEHGIESIYVCGRRLDKNSDQGAQTHAWLLVDGLIADISADQSKNNEDYLNYDIPDYYGTEDEYHRLFEVRSRDVHPSCRLNEMSSFAGPRLQNLYNIISKYI